MIILFICIDFFISLRSVCMIVIKKNKKWLKQYQSYLHTKNPHYKLNFAGLMYSLYGQPRFFKWKGKYEIVPRLPFRS